MSSIYPYPDLQSTQKNCLYPKSIWAILWVLWRSRCANVTQYGDGALVLPFKIWVGKKSVACFYNLLGSFHKSGALLETPNSRIRITRTPTRKDPQFLETAILEAAHPLAGDQEERTKAHTAFSFRARSYRQSPIWQKFLKPGPQGGINPIYGLGTLDPQANEWERLSSSKLHPKNMMRKALPEEAL